MRCDRCRYSGDKHDPACPESMSGVEKNRAKDDWNNGYQMGRSGREKPADSNAYYSLGYHEGVVALEEAENGHDPRFDDPVNPSEEELWDEMDDRWDDHI